jgi:hypothetical protein
VTFTKDEKDIAGKSHIQKNLIVDKSVKDIKDKKDKK